MRIDYILKAAAKRMRTVSVAVDRSYGTVCISDDTGEQEDIVMQGDDAESFIAECDKLSERCQSLDGYIIEMALAEPYAENLWN